MRPIKLSLAIFGLLALSVNALYGQDYDFKVMSTRGDNSLRDASSRITKLQVGTMVSEGQTITVGASGYLLLITPGSNYIELRSANGDEYKISDLEPMVSAQESLLKRYSKYLVGKMSPEAVEENRKKYATITGATERGMEEITLFMSTSANILDNMAVIRWEYPKDGVTYRILFKDFYEELLKELETDESFVWIDLDAEEFKGQGLVSVTVSVAGEEDVNSGAYSIQKISESDASAYYTEYMELKSSLVDSPFSNLILAEFYEQKELLLDALTCHERAIEQSQGLAYFKEAYRGFLLRNGYTDKPF